MRLQNNVGYTPLDVDAMGRNVIIILLNYPEFLKKIMTINDYEHKILSHRKLFDCALDFTQYWVLRMLIEQGFKVDR